MFFCYSLTLSTIQENPYNIKTHKSRSALSLSLSTDSKPQELGHLEHLFKMLGLFYSITTPREIFAAQDASRIAGCSCLQAPSVNK